MDWSSGSYDVVPRHDVTRCSAAYGAQPRPVIGKRYRSLEKEDYDLCEASCEGSARVRRATEAQAKKGGQRRGRTIAHGQRSSETTPARPATRAPSGPRAPGSGSSPRSPARKIQDLRNRRLKQRASHFLSPPVCSRRLSATPSRAPLAATSPAAFAPDRAREPSTTSATGASFFHLCVF